MIINSKKYKGFVYDNCHEFYLVENEITEQEMLKYGWELKDIRPLKELTTNLWLSACPLRFINTFAGLKTIIPQCSRVKIIKIV